MKRKRYKRLVCLFAALAILLSNAMCAAAAYTYCSLQWGGRSAGYSAPASAAFSLCVPYGAGIAICAAIAWSFHQRGQRAG